MTAWRWVFIVGLFVVGYVVGSQLYIEWWGRRWDAEMRPAPAVLLPGCVCDGAP